MSLTTLRSRCVDQIRALHASAAGRAWTPDEEAKFASLESEVAEIDQRLAVIESASGEESRGRRTRPAAPGSSHDGRASDSQVLRAWLRAGTPLEQGEDRAVLQSRGWHGGMNAIEFGRSNLEARAIGKTATAGLELVPTTLAGEVSRTMQAFAPVRAVARVLQTDAGESLQVPTSSDVSNSGEIIAENAAHNEQDVAFSSVTLGAFQYSSKIVRCSNQLLQDSGIDLAQFLGSILGERIGRIQSTHFLTGSGSGQPQGLITAAGTVSAALSASIGVNDLINLLFGVDQAYLADGGAGSVGWMMSPTTFGLIRKLADNAGNPLLQPLVDGGPPRLLGYPVYFAPEMATPAASAKSVLFGNFSYYLVRDAGPLVVARSNERYFEYNQSAFLAIQRTDAKLLQAGAVKVLAHPAATTTTTSTTP